MMIREFKFRGWVRDQKRMIYANLDEIARGNWSSPLYWCDLMQYIGLKDMNKHDIYEGDIVSGTNRIHDFRANQEVKFLNGCYMIGNWNAHEYFNKHTYIEIIGNIYENSGLLTQSK